MVDRREFFQRAALGSALFGIPWPEAERALAGEPPPFPSSDLFHSNPQRYWTELRRQWLLAPNRINLNCGSLGCSPLPVVRAMIDHLLASEAFGDVGYPWFGYEENALLGDLRTALAGFLHCQRDELALLRNATEGNNTVCHGLDLKSGDEVVLTNQEHPGGRCCWEQRAARHGIKLRYVQLPKPPASVDQMIELFKRALTPRTRVLMFSHITSPTGLVLPARELCTLARSKGVLSHVDGAHAIGQIPLNLHEMGCDFYVTSPHKWLLAPKGTGTLFIREDLLDRLWVHTASNQWRNYGNKAYRFSNLGTSNLSVMAGLKAALDFHLALGPARVYTRIHEQAGKVRAEAARHPQLYLGNASADMFYAGLVNLCPVKGTLGGIVKECAARKIRISGGPDTMRIATHIFTLDDELRVFFDAIKSGLRARAS